MKNKIPENTGEGPVFELPVENELLMLKLRAEFGAECTKGADDIPPAVVNEFLRSVYEFERKFREPMQLVKIYDRIGRPPFRREGTLSNRQVSKELARLLTWMRDHQLVLDVLGSYPERLIYRFITEEFFGHEIEDLKMPGYVHHFCYEDFHPNHEMDIRNRATEFLTQWFNRKISEYSWQIADPLIHPDTREFSKADVLKRIHNVFAAFEHFRNCSYEFDEISFEWDDQKNSGRGYAGGTVKYEGVTESKRVILLQGPFQFYFTNTADWWHIFYFIFPGFRWSDK